MDSKQSGHEASRGVNEGDFDDAIDIRDLFVRLGRGLGQIVGLGLLGMVVAVGAVLISLRLGDVTTTTRVAFSFPGLEKGAYPDGSKFQAEDLRAPDVILEALKRRGMNASEDSQSKIRSSLNVEGIVPTAVTQQRDKMRAAGQNPPPYQSDEYSLSLLLPQSLQLSLEERARLMTEIVNAFREKFLRTYVSIPVNFGSGFDALKDADYVDYEFILKEDLRGVIDYLDQQRKANPTYRSPTTNLTFNDLLSQAQNFAQIRVFETLGTIRTLGLSSDRRAAVGKLDFAIMEIGERINAASEREKVVRELLERAQAREQSYVLGVKSQATQPRPEGAILDQGLVDSLVANDAYNFLVRRALDVGIEVKNLESERAQLADRRRALGAGGDDPASQAAGIASVKKSLGLLETAYRKLIDDIRKTRDDFGRQSASDAVRITAAIKTAGINRTLVVSSGVGAFVGAALGAGLALLGIAVGKR